MITLVPFLLALALIAVVVAPFVGPFALALLLVAFVFWGLWKVTANVLDWRGENVFRLVEPAELLGRGGPDDPDFILVHRRPNGTEQEAPTHEVGGGPH